MTNKELLQAFDGFSEELLTVLGTSERLKKQVQTVLEENARLRLENRQLQELLAQRQAPVVEKNTHNTGKEHLEQLYNEGFHVCNDFYGQSRGSREDCLICMELLYRDDR
ncbi:initiation control protein YabA [Streptococcus entericus]|uniref:initiation control protein YabA n=1 Tax=Streptococcus entericus TaxID=155680 RepID=UPI000370DA3C|nr:initiation control protein YabA [Streptococcus entericus]